jgi:CDP-diacylglycerol--glycerol-3-phosphate 3-phosphatidyltransferase
MLTFGGLIVSGLAGYLAARGLYVWAGVAIILGGPLDALDGAVARVTGRESRFGAMLDSVLDRYGEALILAGLGYHLMQTGRPIGAVLATAALFGSVMVSYARARSEGLGVDYKGGLLTRFERLALLVLALLTGYVVPALWVLAVLAHITVAQRVLFVWRATRDERRRP